jgi:hypothetical protein
MISDSAGTWRKIGGKSAVEVDGLKSPSVGSFALCPIDGLLDADRLSRGGVSIQDGAGEGGAVKRAGLSPAKGLSASMFVGTPLGGKPPECSRSMCSSYP